MISISSHLEPEQQSQARLLWDNLMYAPSRVALEEARRHLKAADPSVRQAVTEQIARLWQKGLTAEPDGNPFA